MAQQATAPIRYDLAVRDRAGRVVLLVEVKGRRGTSPAWAAKMRRNLVIHGSAPVADFFLLVTADCLYLWEGSALGSLDEIEPAVALDAEDLLGIYFAKAGLSLAHAGGAALELVVAAWLRDLTEAPVPAISAEPSAWSRMVAAVSAGEVTFEHAA